MLGYNGNYCGLDVESSKFPAGYPWHEGYYLSVVSITNPVGKRSWLLTHDENMDGAFYFDYKPAIAEIQEELNKYDVIVGHNLKYDLNVLRWFGVDFTNHKLFCTMVAEYLIMGQERGLDLNELATRYGETVKDDRVKTMWQAGYNTAQIPKSILVPYCEHDCDVARRVAHKQFTKLIMQGQVKLFNLQMEFMLCLSEMETNGFKWNQAEADAIIAKYKRYEAVYVKRLRKLLGRDDLNLDSGDDLSAALYGGSIQRDYVGPVIKHKNVRVQMPYVFTYKNGKQKYKVRWRDHKNTKVIRYVQKKKLIEIPGLGIKPPPRSETKKSTAERRLYKTNKDVLPKLRCNTPAQTLVVALLLKRSKIQKALETFVGKTDATGLCTKVGTDGNIHTNFNQTVTRTGRLSSSDPNGQNLPRGNTSPIKRCIVPTLDEIMNSDLSQIEWRVPAWYSQDPTMIHEINNGIDQHIAAVKELMELPFKGKGDPQSKKNRDNAKTFNFRMIYKGSAWGFHMDPRMPKFGIKKWERVVNAFWRKYAQFKLWHSDVISKVIKNHGLFVTPTGRRFAFKLDTNSGRFNEREIANYPIQGMAGGDILPLAIVYIRRYMRKYKLKSKMILTVHDSVVFDLLASEREQLTKICMRVFSNLPKLIHDYFGLNWNVDLTGEVEVGPTYGQLKQIA